MRIHIFHGQLRFNAYRLIIFFPAGSTAELGQRCARTFGNATGQQADNATCNNPMFLDEEIFHHGFVSK